MLFGSSGNLEIYGVIAHGGMATIQYARLLNAAGALEVVIKRPHEHFAKDPEFVKMLMDEAKLSLRIQHANVVRTLGVIEDPSLGLVLEYIHGEPLSALLELARAAGKPVPVAIATALLSGVLHGLHAAHETRADDGRSLRIVHRDVSPENILVGIDGLPRLLDFGIAKAVGRIRCTPSGEWKGKLAYLAPEQLNGGEVTRRTDVYSAAIVLWETLAAQPLFREPDASSTLAALLQREVPSLCALRDDVPEALDRIVARGLAREPAERQPSALALARALEQEVGVAAQTQLVDWMDELAGEQLRARKRKLTTPHAPARAAVRERQTVVLPEPVRPASTRVRVRGAGLRVAAATMLLLLVALGAIAADRSLRESPSEPEPPPRAVSSLQPSAANTPGLQPALASPVAPAVRPEPPVQPNARAARRRAARAPAETGVPVENPARPLRSSFVPIGPPECYELVRKDGIEARVLKQSCLGVAGTTR